VRDLRIGYASTGGANAFVPLRDIADITLDTGATYIYHERNERYIPIKFSVRERDLGSTVSELQQRVAAEVKLPEGYRIQYAGEFESLQQAKARMAVLIPMAMALILVLLYALFSSFAYSLLALVAVPFTVACGILALFVSDQVISISAVIGFVSLLGVSVMDGILILSYFKELRLAGKSAEDAVYEAYIHRMRPLLMTAFSACIGLFPAALSHGIGSQVQRPLATVVVGGMLLGPLFLLLVVPAMRLTVLRGLKLKKRRKGLGGDALAHEETPMPDALKSARAAAVLRLLAGALASVGLLSACAVGPDYHAPAAPEVRAFTRQPAAPDPAPAAELRPDWWRAYGSPRLDALVQRALAHNPGIDAGLANLRQAQELVTAQRGLFFPQAQAGYSANRQNSGQVLSSPLASGANVFTLHTAQLSVGFVPDVWGGNRRQVESCRPGPTASRCSSRPCASPWPATWPWA
jgi:hypothetical protein